MQQLTAQGRQIVADLAQRHGFSSDAVSHMLLAVWQGNGSMAQFNHPEFGGSGQWMLGGMLMLGDMFNHSLKGRVETLCCEISEILAGQPGLLHSGSFQSQSQSGSGQQSQAAGVSFGQSSLFVPDPSTNWWPSELGSPNAVGSQNNVRYAYFANQRRLAVQTGSDVWVYDTQDHNIGGFSQQQGSGGSILLTSQYGTVNLSSLPVVFRSGQPVRLNETSSFAPQTPDFQDTSAADKPAGQPPSTSNDVFAALERLGDLKAKGILTDEEFATKKAELLARL